MMANIKVTCPYCKCTHVVFNGKTRAGAQKCCCRECGKTFQTSYSYNARKPGTKETIIDMVMNGSGTRDTARVLGISKDTVTRTLRGLKDNVSFVNTDYLNSLEPNKEINIDVINLPLEDDSEYDEETVKEYRNMLSVEMDEMWSYIHDKHHQCWLWWAIDHDTSIPLAFTFGTREHCNLDVLLGLLEPFPINRYYTDKNFAYVKRIPEEKLVLSKKNTQRIERYHLTLRTRIKRLARKTICFSKLLEIHVAVIGTFINMFFFTPLAV